jgi:hypothetical protein
MLDISTKEINCMEVPIILETGVLWYILNHADMPAIGQKPF